MILDQAYRYITELKQQNDTLLLNGGDKVQGMSTSQCVWVFWKAFHVGRLQGYVTRGPLAHAWDAFLVCRLHRICMISEVAFLLVV